MRRQERQAAIVVAAGAAGGWWVGGVVGSTTPLEEKRGDKDGVASEGPERVTRNHEVLEMGRI